VYKKVSIFGKKLYYAQQQHIHYCRMREAAKAEKVKLGIYGGN